MILIRPAEPKDLKELVALAAYLDSMNLPQDKNLLQTMIHISQDSFAHHLKSKQRGRFLFVAENTRSGKVVGCSAIFSQHGTEQRPHLYFQVHEELQKSHYLNHSVRRKYVTLEKKSDGPTEMCSLVVLPRYRRTPHQIGLQLALARYLYIWKHPTQFKKKFLSELNGVIRKKDLGNDLWDVLGGKLTGLDYHTADRLSAQSKEFVLALYPKTRFYVDLLPEKGQRVLEQVGKESIGALKILKKIGFHYLRQCCPFDGGPHYGADWKEISLFKKIKELKLSFAPFKNPSHEGLVALEVGKIFYVVRTPFSKMGGEIFLPREVVRLFQKKIKGKLLEKVKLISLELPI